MNYWQQVKQKLEEAGVTFSKEAGEYSGDTIWVARIGEQTIAVNITLGSCLRLAEEAFGGNVVECA